MLETDSIDSIAQMWNQHFQKDSCGEPSLERAQSSESKSISVRKLDRSKFIFRTLAPTSSNPSQSHNFQSECTGYYMLQRKSALKIEKHLDYSCIPQSSNEPGLRLFLAKRFLTRLALDKAMGPRPEKHRASNRAGFGGGTCNMMLGRKWVRFKPHHQKYCKC